MRPSLTPEYAAWQGMRARCHRKTHADYQEYGGRGIVVCERWLGSFSAFLADVGLRPSPRHSLDRRNNDGNYEPGNVRWATAKEQANNRRSPKPKKLTDDAVRALRARYAAGGVTQQALADEYGVTQGVVSNIVNRRARVEKEIIR